MWIDDLILKEANRDYFQRVWTPEETVVVCGRSNRPEVECRLEKCHEDGVSVLKRYGGGGTVVLHSGCVVVSVGAWVDSYYDNDQFFKALNNAVINALSKYRPKFAELSQDGLSDIVYNDKKIAGTSLFRSRYYLLYQASILFERGAELIEKYLAHPSKEPDYRKGRSHSDFVTDLSTIDNSATLEGMSEVLRSQFKSALQSELGKRLVSSHSNQVKHILSKIERD